MEVRIRWQGASGVTRADRKFYRTIVLGLVALGVLVWAAMDRFGVSRGEVVDIFVGTLLVVSVTIFTAALCAVCWIATRQWYRRSDSDK